MSGSRRRSVTTICSPSSHADAAVVVVATSTAETKAAATDVQTAGAVRKKLTNIFIRAQKQRDAGEERRNGYADIKVASGEGIL